MRDQYGINIAASIEEVAQQSDAILLTSVDGRIHLEQFALLAPFGKPVFIDKPFETSYRDARKLADHSADSPSAAHELLFPTLRRRHRECDHEERRRSDYRCLLLRTYATRVSPAWLVLVRNSFGGDAFHDIRP